MDKINAIERAIRELTRRECAQLTRWFYSAIDDEWDHQMKADAQAGRLDHLMKQADVEIDNGNLREFP